MAILYKNSEGYKALAFWALNENVDRSKDDLKKYVISIDKLEELTGIDFFCNLPDDVENKVEAATYTQSWKWQAYEKPIKKSISCEKPLLIG